MHAACENRRIGHTTDRDIRCLSDLLLIFILHLKLVLDFGVFSSSVYSTDYVYSTAGNAEIDHLYRKKVTLEISVISFSQTLQSYCDGSTLCSFF